MKSEIVRSYHIYLFWVWVIIAIPSKLRFPSWWTYAWASTDGLLFVEFLFVYSSLYFYCCLMHRSNFRIWWSGLEFSRWFRRLGISTAVRNIRCNGGVAGLLKTWGSIFSKTVNIIGSKTEVSHMEKEREWLFMMWRTQRGWGLSIGILVESKW